MNITRIKKISIIFNEIFKFSIIFLAVFVWVRRYFTAVASIAISFCASIIVYLIIRAILSKRNNKKTLSQQDSQKAEKLSNSLLFSTDNEIDTFFCQALKTKNISFDYDGFFVLNNEKQKSVLIPYYKKELFETDDLRYVFNMVKNLSVNKVIICVHATTKTTMYLAKSIGNFDVIILEQEDVYAQFGNCEIAEKLCPFVEKKKPKYGFAFFVAYALNKKRAKGYFLSAFVLLFSSFFLRINIYYLIMSSVLLLLAFVSLFNPRFNKIKNTSIFD